jgi:hypothetical protein
LSFKELSDNPKKIKCKLREFIMRTKIILFFLLLFCFSANAQKVKMVIITPPHTAFISDVMNNPDLFQVRLTNTTNQDLTVKIGARLLLDLKVISEADIDASQPYTLKPGLNIYNLEDAYKAILKGGVSLDGQFQEVLQSGQWPSGLYQWCFSVKGFNDGEDYIREQCSFKSVTAYSTPYLISPLDKQALTNPPSIIFRWMPVTPNFKEGLVTYKVRVFDIKTGQTPTQALQTNLPILDKEVQGLKMLIWPTEIPIEAGEYIWTVEAQDKEGRTIGLPDKYAPPFTFKVIKTTTQGGIFDIPIVSANFPSDKAKINKDNDTNQPFSFDVDLGSKIYAKNDSNYYKIFVAARKTGDIAKVTLNNAITDKKLLYESEKLPIDQTFSKDNLKKVINDTIKNYVWRIVFYAGAKKYESATYTFDYETPSKVVPPSFEIKYPADKEMVKQYSADSTKFFSFEYNLGSAAKDAKPSELYVRVYVIPKRGQAKNYADSMAFAIKNNQLVYKSDSIPYTKKASRDYVTKSLAGRKDTAYLIQMIGYMGKQVLPSKIQSFDFDRKKPLTKIVDSCECKVNECDFPEINDKVAKAKIAVKDTLSVGHYKLIVNEVTNESGSAAAGKAKIQLPLGLQLSTNFDKLKINKNGEAFNGTIRTQQDDIYKNLDLAKNKSVWKIDSAVYKDLSAHLNSLVANVTEGFTVPFSLKRQAKMAHFDLPFDVIVTDFIIANDKALMNALMVIPIGDGKYVKFAADSIPWNKNGVKMNKLKLWLAEDVVIPGIDDKVPIKLVAAKNDDPLRGSYAIFDCKGLKEFNLQGEVTFPKNSLVVAGKKEASTANLLFNFAKWGDFIAKVNMGDFEIASWDYNQFSITEAVYDRSPRRNAKEIVFPKGYKGDTTAAWKGFFIKKAAIKIKNVPIFNEYIADNGFGVVAENVMLDSNKVSGSFWGTNVFNLKTDKENPKWQLALDTLMIDVLQNEIKSGQITGKIMVPIMEKPSSFVGKIEKRKDETYLATIEPKNDFTLEIWRAKAALLEGSTVTIDEQIDTVATKKFMQSKPDSVKAKKITKNRYYADLNTQLTINITLDTLKKKIQDTTFITALKERLGIDVLDFELPALTAHNMKINHPDLDEEKVRFGLDSMSYSGAFKIGGIDMNLRAVKVLKDSITIDSTKTKHKGLGLQFSMSKGIDVDLFIWAVQTSDTSSSTGYKFGKYEIKYTVPKFSCSIPDSLKPKLTSKTEKALVVNNVYKIGGFNFTPTKLPSGATAGEGIIRIPFLGTDYPVQFGNTLKGNDKNEIIEGAAYTVPPKDIFTEKALVTKNGVLSVDFNQMETDKDFMENLKKKAVSFTDIPISFNRMLSRISQVMGGTDIKVPFDAVVTGFVFKPEGGQINAMAIIKVDDKYPRIGVYGVRMLPDKIALDQLKFYLMSDL